MIRRRHNQYVSTPDWFTSQTSTEVNTVQTPVVQTIISSYNEPVDTEDDTTVEVVSDIPMILYNKSLYESAELDGSSLMNKSKAVSIDNDTSGELITDVLYASTNYIEVVSGSEISIYTNYSISVLYGIAFYALNHSVISTEPIVRGIQNLIIPKTARYFRICAQKEDSSFKVNYSKPFPYPPETLREIYNGSLDDYTKLKFPQETINEQNNQITKLSLVADYPLKLEIDSNNNLHFNINEMFNSWDKYVTVTDEPQLVEGVKTFERGIGIGDYLLVPDSDKESLKLIHKDDGKLGNLYTTGWLSAMDKSEDDEDSATTIVALHELIDVLSDGDEVKGATKDALLTYDGTHWYGKVPDKINVMEDVQVDGTTITKANGKLSVVNMQRITVDYSLSTISTNPVANKVITNKINSLIQSVSSADEAINGEPGVLYVLH